MAIFKDQDDRSRDEESSRKNRHRDQESANKNDDQDDNDRFQWKKASRTSLLWIAILIGTIIIAQVISMSQGTEQEVTYSEYKQYLSSGRIAEATIIDNEFHGTLKTPATKIVNGREVQFTDFVLILPYVDETMLESWNQAGVDYTFEEESVDWFGYLLNMLPWILLIFFWFYLMRRMQGGGSGGGIFSFGKSRAKMFDSDNPQVTFKDVAGVDEAKQEMTEIIEYLKNPTKFQGLGGKIPRGALLLGPPGTGKTLLARAVAGEAGVPFFNLSGADFVEMFVGVGASRVRDLFEQGKKNAPCIIFIDEIDAVGRHRGAGIGGGHDEREQTLNQLLVEMDGFDTNDSVILLAATNRPDVLDNALLRPGRFDRQIVVDVPDYRGRHGILRVHTKEIPLADDIDLEVIAKSTPGMVGADLANVVNEAALLAARRGADKVHQEDFEEAKDKVTMGIERKSRVINEKDKKVIAYHEAGHTLVAKFMPHADPVHKVTIIPRGQALGITHQLPLDDRYNYSRSYLKTQLAIMMGGRTAEEIKFNEITTGAGNDIKRATDMARKMVTEWGMSDKLGPLTFGDKEEEIFLGREIAQHRDFSDETAMEIDREVRGLIDEAHENAKRILTENLEILNTLSEALLEHETLDQEEIDIIASGGSVNGKDSPKASETEEAEEPVRESRDILEAETDDEESVTATDNPVEETEVAESSTGDDGEEEKPSES
ncbi:MAG: ATP-dependent zinc metalloprotease FtsH [Candidatus Marinimicrobia bacterium]|nr:ATP-dependent zinc metalloprotease FtsH [Candidatus Neomarinimicrobiota bacterium]MCF7828982.1 ATP-dependent zinc metalloprotease FtsH [Candidatus Neomarinimicrobiota bacterium]MCF7879942.1 ATP-dependent zinc metalloprotease FtsH [Candidatus Neomarinimicrobiota bacterium]